MHSVQPCGDGVRQKNWDSETWLLPLEAQIAGLRLVDEAATAIADALSKPEPMVVPIERGRIDHQRRQLALDVAAGKIGERAFLMALRRLSEEEARIDAGGSSKRDVNATRRWPTSSTPLRAGQGRPATKATMVQTLYEEIVVRGSEFVSVRLTPEAYAHGLALALPEEVVVRAAGTAAEKLGIGAPDRIRTCDLRLRRPTLYPLSYRREPRS